AGSNCEDWEPSQRSWADGFQNSRQGSVSLGFKHESDRFLWLYFVPSVRCSAVPVTEVEDLESNTHRCKYAPDRYRGEAVVRESPPHENGSDNERDPWGIGASNIQHVPSLVQFPFRSLKQNDTLVYGSITLIARGGYMLRGLARSL